MGNKKINKKVAQKIKKLNYLNAKEADILGFVDEGNNTPAFVYLKYYDYRFECFSDWEKDELKQFSQFIEKMRKTTWTNIYKSGGKSGNKTGFGYTVHKDTNVLPNQDLVELLSEDVTFFELRIKDKIRVHGFRSKSAFCLIWLDRAHRIYPM